MLTCGLTAVIKRKCYYYVIIIKWFAVNVTVFLNYSLNERLTRFDCWQVTSATCNSICPILPTLGRSKMPFELFTIATKTQTRPADFMWRGHKYSTLATETVHTSPTLSFLSPTVIPHVTLIFWTTKLDISRALVSGLSALESPTRWVSAGPD